MRVFPGLAPAVQFGASKKESDLQTYYSRLQGIAESLQNESLKVTSVTFPNGFTPKYIGEARITAVLEKGGKKFDLSMGGNMSGRNFTIESQDKQTEYTYRSQAGSLTLIAHDKRPGKSFQMNQEIDLFAEEAGKSEVAKCGSELKKALEAAVLAFRESSKSAFDGVKANSDF